MRYWYMMICGLGRAMIEADVTFTSTVHGFVQLSPVIVNCLHSPLQFTHVKEEIQC